MTSLMVLLSYLAVGSVVAGAASTAPGLVFVASLLGLAAMLDGAVRAGAPSVPGPGPYQISCAGGGKYNGGVECRTIDTRTGVVVDRRD